jgi:hypothetical protein
VATIRTICAFGRSASLENASPARTDGQNLLSRREFRARRARRRGAPPSIAIWRFQNRNTNVSLPAAYRMVFRFGV